MSWLNSVRIYLIYHTRMELTRVEPLQYRLVKWKLKKPDCTTPNKLIAHFRKNERVTAASLGIGGANPLQLELLAPLADAMNALLYDHRRPEAELARARAVLLRDVSRHSLSWLDKVETICLCGGLFQFAYELRALGNQRLIQAYAKRRRVRSQDAVKLFWAYLTDGMDVQAEAVHSRMNPFARFILKNPFHQIYYLMGLHNHFSTKAMLRGKAEQAYLELVQGKRIAILGPSAGVLDIAEVQRDFDLLARMTYRGRDLLVPEQQTLKTNISYYCTLAARRIHGDHLDTRYMDELDFAVFKTDHEAFEKQLIDAGRARLTLSMGMYTFYNAGPNMLQTMLFDLLHFQPERIKVFNVNLFLAKQRYQPGYKIPNTVQDKISFWRSFGMHNLMSMFVFTKGMYTHGVIEADEECGEVLSMTLAQYVEGMQALEWADLLGTLPPG